MQIKSSVLLQSTFILFLCFFSASFSFADEYDLLPVQQNRKLLKLNGDVSFMKEQKWILKNDSAIYSTTSSLNVDDKFIMLRSEEASFDNIGNILNLKTSTQKDEKQDKMKDSIRYFYYDKNRVIAIVNKSEGKMLDSIEFHYLRKGLLDYYRLFGANGKVQYKITYVYKNKKVFTIRKKNDENLSISMIKFKYKEDKLSECQFYDDQFKLIEIRRFASRSNIEGNKDESYSVTDAAGIMKGGLTMTRDKSGNVLEQSAIDGERTVSEYDSYKYDGRGNRTEAKIFSATQEIHFEYRYTYDTNNNWVKKEVFANDLLTSIVTRDYTYN